LNLTFPAIGFDFGLIRTKTNHQSRKSQGFKRPKRAYLTIRGGSLKKIEKKIIPNVPINKKV
jgi:hypothetical protein